MRPRGARGLLAALGSALALAALASSCGRSGGLETATEMPVARRRPDGVVLETTPAMPVAVDRAPAIGIIALREPLADKDVDDVVRAYLRAFEREDIDELVQLLAQDASPLGRAGGKNQLIELWRTKMKSFEYHKLGGAEVARFARLEKLAYDEFGVSGVPSRPRPAEMRSGDLYVRVPIATPRIGTDPLFGDVLVLLLRREDGCLKVAGQADE